MSTQSFYSMKGSKNKKEERFLQVYDKYHQDIFRFCMFKLRDRTHALDITQETFMKFWEYLVNDTLDARQQERALLYKIAHHRIIDFFKKKKSIPLEDMSILQNEHTLSHTPLEQLSDHIDGTQLIYLLHKLPPQARDLLILRFVQDLSITEIADLLDMRKNTVSVNIHRALEKLKVLVQQEYETKATTKNA